MRTDGLTVFEYMDDFDNQELDQFEWRDQMLSAVLQYNKEYGTEHDPAYTLKRYCYQVLKKDSDV